MFVYVGVGSNLGDSRKTVSQALQAIAQLPDTTSFAASRLYLTDPVSDIPQNRFINAVCRFKTEFTPSRLFQELEQIERQLGKVPKPKNAPRPIDLDLLVYGDFILNEPYLQVPHPEWTKRLFVLRPLADLTSVVKIGEIVYDIPQMIFELSAASKHTVDINR
jgi:2-amino-4-hydroxy-6-hydroxymethyldihydropteridine diphosphokinase